MKLIRKDELAELLRDRWKLRCLEMAKSGYNIYNVSSITRSTKDFQGHYIGEVYKGFSATFKKQLR